MPDIVPVFLCPINWGSGRFSEPASQLADVGAGAYDVSPFLGAVYARDGAESKCKGIVFDEVLVIDDCLFLADMAHGEGMWDGNRREARETRRLIFSGWQRRQRPTHFKPLNNLL